MMVSGSIAFHAEKSTCTPPKSEIWEGFCFVKTSDVLPDNIAAALWLQSSNHILISENWYLVEESANLSPLSCQWKLDWTIVNHKSNASPSLSKFTIILLNPLLEQNAIRPALPLTSHCTKMKFPMKDFFSKWPNAQFPADLVTFTEEILNGKRHFFCAVLHCWPVSFFSKCDSFHELIIWDHPFYSAHAKFSEKVTLRTLWRVHVRVRIRGTKSKFFGTFCVCTKCMTPLWANSFKCNTVSTFPLSYPTIRSVKISDTKRFSILKGLSLNKYSTHRYFLASCTKESHHDTL